MLLVHGYRHITLAQFISSDVKAVKVLKQFWQPGRWRAVRWLRGMDAVSDLMYSGYLWGKACCLLAFQLRAYMLYLPMLAGSHGFSASTVAVHCLWSGQATDYVLQTCGRQPKCVAGA